jgi:hypothetical protein
MAGIWVTASTLAILSKRFDSDIEALDHPGKHIVDWNAGEFSDPTCGA